MFFWGFCFYFLLLFFLAYFAKIRPRGNGFHLLQKHLIFRHVFSCLRSLEAKLVCAELGLRSWACGVGLAELGLRSWACGVGLAELGLRRIGVHGVTRPTFDARRKRSLGLYPKNLVNAVQKFRECP